MAEERYNYEDLPEDLAASRVTFVGAAYFGGLRLMSRLKDMSFREKIDAFLVKRNIIEPEIVDVLEIDPPRSPNSTVDIWFGNHENLGPGIPGFEEDGLFGPRAAAAEANTAKVNREVSKVINEFTSIINSGNDHQRQNALNAIAHVVGNYKTRSIYPNSGILQGIKAEDVYLGQNGAYEKALERMGSRLSAGAPVHADVARLASDLKKALNLFVKRMPLDDVDMPVEYGNVGIDTTAATSMTNGPGIVGRPSLTANHVNLEVQKEIWASRTRGAIKGNALIALNDALAESNVYDGGITLLNAEQRNNIVNNKRELIKTIDIYNNAEHVDNVGLVEVKTIKGIPFISGDPSSAIDHQVAVIRVTASSPADPSKKVVSFKEIPLMSKFNTFISGAGDNVRAGVLHINENIWDNGMENGVKVRPASLRPGGLLKDIRNPMGRFNDILMGNVDMEIRETIEGTTLPGATRSIAEDMFGRRIAAAYGNEARLITSQNLNELTQGTRVTYGATQVARQPKSTTMKRRLSAIQQFKALNKTGKARVYLDIETLAEDTTAHPWSKVDHTDIYQVAAIKVDAKGNTVGQYIWWVKSDKPVTEEWARHTIDSTNPKDITAQAKWMTRQIQGGKTIEEVMDQVGALVYDGVGEAAQIVTHYGKQSDMPTIRNIIQQISGGMQNQNAIDALMLTGDDTLIDTWEMATHGLRATGQSLELERLALDVHGVNKADIVAQYKKAFKDKIVKVFGNAPDLLEDFDKRYVTTHSPLMDAHLTMAIAINMMNEDNPIAKSLGNTEQAEYYKKAVSPVYAPAMLPATLNMGTLMAHQGVHNFVDEVSSLISLTGHPDAMGKGIKNFNSLANFIPFGQFYTAWRRGSGHKRSATAQFHHDARDALIQSDVHRGQLPGSTLYPHFVTDKMLELLPDGAARAHTVGHFMNATVAYANSRYAVESNVLGGTRVQALKTIRNQDNYPIQLPTGATSAKIIGKSKGMVSDASLDRASPGRSKGVDAQYGEVESGEVLLIQYTGKDGSVGYENHVYQGPKAAIVRGEVFNSLNSTLIINRDVIQEFRSAIRGSLLGSNTTVEAMNRLFYRVGDGSSTALDSGRNIDLLASWKNEGVYKYGEHGRTAEMVMGKVVGPLLEKARLGATPEEEKIARQALNDIFDVLPNQLLELKDVEYENSFPGISSDVRPTVRIPTVVERRIDKVIDLGTAMNELVNWNTLTKIYTVINKHPELVPHYSKYSEGSKIGKKELHDVIIEMQKMEDVMTDEIRDVGAEVRKLEMDHRDNPTKIGLEELRDARNRKATLIKDIRAFKNFSKTHIKSGGFKFYETIMQAPVGNNAPEEFIGFVTTALFGIGVKSPEENMKTFPIDEFPTDFAGNPEGMNKLRHQSIQLMDEAWKGMDIDERYRTTMLNVVKEHLGKNAEHYPAIKFRLAEFEYVFGTDPLPGDIKKIVTEQLSVQVTKINQAIESVRLATEHTQNHIFSVKIEGQDREYPVTDVLTEKAAVEKIATQEGVSKDRVKAIRIPTSKLGLMASAVDPSILHGKVTYDNGAIDDIFLNSSVPLAIKVPEHLQQFATINFKQVEELIKESKSLAGTEHTMQILRAMHGGPREEIRMPSLGFDSRAMGEGGTVELSRLQLTALNLASRLQDASISKNPQNHAALTTHVTKYYSEMSKFIGRHNLTGVAGTSFLPGSSNLLAPIQAAGYIQKDAANLGSRYTEFHTVTTSRSQGVAEGIPKYLENMGKTAVEIEDIMSGKTAFMEATLREPDNYTTSLTITQRYFMADKDFVGSSAGMSPEELKTASKGVARLSGELFGQVHGDADGDIGQQLIFRAKSPDEFHALQLAMKHIHKRSGEEFMKSGKWRTEDLILNTGATSRHGTKQRFIRQEVVTGNGEKIVKYVTFDEAHRMNSGISSSELDLISNQLDAAPQIDTDLYKMFTGKKSGIHRDVVGRNESDAAVSALMQTHTGKVTAATWQLRTAFDIMEARGVTKYGDLSLYSEGSPYPEQLVLVDGVYTPASRVRGILKDSINNPDAVTGADVFADIIDTLTISKRKEYFEASADIDNWTIAMDPRTPRDERVDRIKRMSTSAKGIVSDDFAGFTADLVDVFHNMDSSAVAKTMYKAAVASTDPTFGDVMEQLHIMNTKKGIDVPFGMAILLPQQYNRENRMQKAQLEAEIAQAGTMEPMYFNKRSFRQMVADEASMELAGVNRGFRVAGIAVAAVAGINFMFPEMNDWFLGGQAQGFGGERYDYFGDGGGLPSQIPLATPEYSWDTWIRTEPNSGKYKKKQDYATFNYNTQPRIQGSYSQSSGANYSTGSYNHRSSPVTSDNMQRRQQPLNPFIGR